MSAGDAAHDGPLLPAPDDGEAEPSEVIDLDTRFGLSAFGSEATAEQPEVWPPPPPPPDAAPDPGLVPNAGVPRRSTIETGLLTPSPHDTGRPADELEFQPAARVPPAPSPAHAPTAPREPARREPDVSSTPRRVHRPIVPALVAGVALLVAVIGTGVWLQRRSAEAIGVPASAPAATSATTGELTVESTPPGALVIIDGQPRGTTPVSLALAPGTYQVDLRAGAERHVVSVSVKAGATTSQHVFLRQAVSQSPGMLRVTSDPPAAAVAVDGRGRGTTPVLITDLEPGIHDLVVTGTSGTVRQKVKVDAAATTTVLVPLVQPVSTPQSTGGWLSIAAPTELQVFEGDRLLGTTRVNRLMLPTGLHTLRLSDEAAGIHLTRQVQIERGQTVRLTIDLPPGTVSINAVPWAAVSVDGRPVGETPLGGLELSPGAHEVVFTHPELGERRQRITVRSGGAGRLSVDMRR